MLENDIGFVLQKKKDKDFVVLVLCDPQMQKEEFAPNHPSFLELKHTFESLLERQKPDLIAVAGDIIDYADTMYFANFINSYNIPWAPVFGNHDHEFFNVKFMGEKYKSFSNCIFDAGNAEMGCGNYVICVEEEGKIVSAIFMMDSHNIGPYKGVGMLREEKWYPAQFAWYEQKVNLLKQVGCNRSAIVQHIPIYAYKLASQKARNVETLALAENKAILREDASQSADEKYWNDGYKGTCFGLQLEGVSCPIEEDGVLEIIQRLNHTTHVVVGHDHNNNTSILYEGVRLTFGLHIGKGCYFDPVLNGGTYLLIDEKGEMTLKHEYVKMLY